MKAITFPTEKQPHSYNGEDLQMCGVLSMVGFVIIPISQMRKARLTEVT